MRRMTGLSGASSSGAPKRSAGAGLPHWCSRDLPAIRQRDGWMTRGPRLSIDIGGTFTDLVLLQPDGRMASLKVSSTPTAPEDAVLTGMQQLLAEAEVEAGDLAEVLHGTTVGSNTLLQKAGARTGLITTKGF